MLDAFGTFLQYRVALIIIILDYTRRAWWPEVPIAELRSEFASMSNEPLSGTTWRRILLQDARF